MVAIKSKLALKEIILDISFIDSIQLLFSLPAEMPLYFTIREINFRKVKTLVLKPDLIRGVVLVKL